MNGIETHVVKDTENKYKESFLKREGKKEILASANLPSKAGRNQNGFARVG